MLTVPASAPSGSTHPLLSLWAKNYLTNSPAFLIQSRSEFGSHLAKATSPNGRDRTIECIRRHLRIHCELAGVETNTLFANHQNIVNLAEVRRLAIAVERVYLSLLEVYARQLFWNFVPEWSRSEVALSETNRILPTIVELAAALDPLLADLKEQHLRSHDPRTIGFVTTQFHFTTRRLLKSLSEAECFLIEPYFRFAEEQVCIPWQQVCRAAMQCVPQSVNMSLVEQFLPQSDEIAQAVYERSLLLGEQYRSRRGSLRSSEVRASVLRDLKMFQAYLWLSVLEGNLETVQKNLLPACLLVFPSVEVSWKLVEAMLGLLMVEIQNRCVDWQWVAVAPMARSLQAVFEISDN